MEAEGPARPGFWQRLGELPHPVERGRPRRRALVGCLVAALLVGVGVGLATGDWPPALVAGFAVHAMGTGVATFRWPTWDERRPPWWTNILWLAFGLLQGLRLAFGDPVERALALSLLVYAVALAPAIVRSHRDQPAVRGWYVDPAGRFPWRWWRGDCWTDHVLAGPNRLLIDIQGAPVTTADNAPR